MNRREVRDSAFKILFAKSLRDDSIEEIYDVSVFTGNIPENIVFKERTEEEIPEEDGTVRIENTVTNLETTPIISTFGVNEDVCEIVDGVLAHVDKIDEIIEKFSKTRAVSRISKLNLAILRVALYEAVYHEGITVNSAINEAVLLADTYANAEDKTFINGVLGSFSRDTDNV